MRITRRLTMVNVTSSGFFSGYRSSLQIPLFLALVSCVSPNSEEVREIQRMPTDAEVEQYNAKVTPEERIVCRNEVPVGTNIPQRRCYFVQELEEIGRFHRRQLRNVLR